MLRHHTLSSCLFLVNRACGVHRDVLDCRLTAGAMKGAAVPVNALRRRLGAADAIAGVCWRVFAIASAIVYVRVYRYV